MRKNSKFPRIFFMITILLGLISACGSRNKKTPDKLAMLHYSTGTEHLMKKDYAVALENLLKANQLKPGDSKINNNLGMAYFFKGNITQAEQHLLESIRLDPKNSDARNNLASVYYHQKKYKESRYQYQHILKDLVYKHQYRTRHNLALIEYQERNYVKAAQLLEEAVKEKFDYCPGHYLLGKVQFRMSQYPKALKSFYEAGKGTCIKYPAPLYQQAVTLTQMQQWDKAFLKYKEIVDRFSTSDYAAKAMSKMRSLDLRRKNLQLPELGEIKKPKKKKNIITQKDLNQIESTNF